MTATKDTPCFSSLLASNVDCAVLLKWWYIYKSFFDISTIFFYDVELHTRLVKKKIGACVFLLCSYSLKGNANGNDRPSQVSSLKQKSVVVPRTTCGR